MKSIQILNRKSSTQMGKYYLGVLILILCLRCSNAQSMHFGRSQTCVQEGKNGCKKWDIKVDLNYYYGAAYYMCFPQLTKVLTRYGQKSLKDIEVDDEILSYDFDQGRTIYSPVIAWLHRDTDSQAQFTVIKTKQGETFRASNGHNIAYNDEGAIGFKYADELKNGQELISLGKNFTVESSSGTSYERGLYSPMTKTSNFYIFSQQSTSDDKQSMILVHCLAQMDNPHESQHWIHKLIKVSGLIGLNSHKNVPHELYLHPATHLMQIFGSEHRKMKYLIATGTDEHLRFMNEDGEQQHFQYLPNNGGSSNWGSGGSSWGSGGSSWGSSSYNSDYGYGGGYYGYNSYYSNRQQQRESRKIQLVSVFTLLMQLNSLITSY